MIQSTSILDQNNWIKFSIQIYFFSKTSLNFFKSRSKYLDQDLNLVPNIWIKFKIQNPFFVKEI